MVKSHFIARLEIIKFVMSERNKLRIAGSKLTPLVYDDEKKSNTDDLILIQKKILKVSETLAKYYSFLRCARDAWMFRKRCGYMRG